MTILRFSEGPKEFGCAYHQRAVHKLPTEDVVVDVFVMPAVQEQRPIALTIGRYRNYKPIVGKQQAALDDPGQAPGRLEAISGLLERLGIDAELSAYMADDVDQFLIREAPAIRAAMLHGR